MLLNELSDYIGSLLEISRFRDYSPNGVQVEGKEQISRIATGVTASQKLLDAAAAWGADAILVHTSSPSCSSPETGGASSERAKAPPLGAAAPGGV